MTVAGNPKTGEIVARIEDDPFKFNRDRFSKGDLILAKKNDAREWPWVIRKLRSVPESEDWKRITKLEKYQTREAKVVLCHI